MSMTVDYARMAAELQWLQDHPEFEERPATIREFIGKDYLNIEGKVRPAVMAELEKIVGEEVHGDKMTEYMLAMFTGGIGIGKTTIASIILPYLAHWVLCLRDPQGFFDLLPGSRIAFMQMSTSGSQAKEVVFGDIKARIEHSPWFQSKYPFDPKFKNQIRFPKDIWILPGDSEETTFEGYNILGGILDEADSHKQTANKDYAEQGYTTIYSRITSRFQKRGFLLVIGQMKKANGFAAKKFEEMRKDPDAYVVRMPIWESFGWDKYLRDDGSRDSFWYDSKRHIIVPEGAARLLDNSNLIEVPTTYRRDFENAPEKALRDLAGIPPATGSPFISLAYRIEEARDRWMQRYNQDPSLPIQTPIKPNGEMYSWFRALNSLKRVCHIDIAYSGDGDALGLAMGHVHEMVEIEGERKPYIVFDMLMRVAAPAGTEIFLGDIRRIIYDLKDELKFKIDKVTMDGFQSTDTRQQLERRRIQTEIISIDRTVLPYHDLREAIYEGRIEFPKYMIKLRHDDTELTEIALKELSELVDNGNKVDHPFGGSKDVADAMAGVVYSLMGDRSYHKGRVRSGFVQSDQRNGPPSGYTRIEHPAIGATDAMRAPLPPSFQSGPFHPSGGAWRPPNRRR